MQQFLVHETQRPRHVVCVFHRLLAEQLHTPELGLRFGPRDCVSPERVVFPKSQRCHYKGTSPVSRSCKDSLLVELSLTNPLSWSIKNEVKHRMIKHNVYAYKSWKTRFCIHIYSYPVKRICNLLSSSQIRVFYNPYSQQYPVNNLISDVCSDFYFYSSKSSFFLPIKHIFFKSTGNWNLVD